MKDRRIKLLFIVNSLQFGGAEKHVVSLVNGLDTRRFRISISYLKGMNALLPQIDARRIETRVRCCNVSRKIDWHAVRALAAQVRDEEIDIVVCTNAYSLLYGALARAFSGKRPRLIEVFHTTSPGSLWERIQLILYRPLFRACDMLVYVSTNQREFWRSSFVRNKPDMVIHNGVDIRCFSDTYSPEQKAAIRQSIGWTAEDYIIGLCAAMRPEKAHVDLLDAVERLHASGIPAKCLLIGDGPERGRLEKKIRERKLEAHVKITGFVDDVRPYVACSDVMSIVSHHVETFSIAALEAMALGKPMVMSRIGGASEQIEDGDNGYLFPAGDIDALELALRRLYDHERQARMGERAYAAVVQRFSLDRMLAVYAQLFIDLAGLPQDKAEVMEHGSAA